MHWNAVPVLVLAGITGYAAILFAGLYAALSKLADARDRQEYLSFCLTCFAVVGYDVTCVWLYNAETVEQGLFWTRLSLVFSALGAIFYSKFVSDFLRRPLPFALRCGNAVLGLLGLAVALWESEYTLTAARAHIRHMVVWGLPITYYEPEYGLLSQLMLLGFFVTLTTLAVLLLRYFRSRDARGQRGRFAFTAAATISAVCMMNDGLSAVGVLDLMYCIEYGFAALLMAMGYVLLMRFGTLHDAVNALNADLLRSNGDLALALEQARESARVKTEFLASISHELRTPLNAIINLPEGLLEDFVPARLARCEACGAEFQLEDGEHLSSATECGECRATGLTPQTRVAFHGEPETVRAALDTVVRAARHLLGLVNDLLDSSKLELGRALIVPVEFKPVELAAEIVASAQTLALQAGVRLQLLERQHSADSTDTIVADRVRIGQVLYNLISNAIKFSPDGGTVDVSVVTPSATEWELRVRDRGIGIAQEHHDMIFEKFRQVDSSATRSYGGTGLGLAISKGLVELHGGRIWVESTVGEGSTFFVRLPRTAGQPADRAEVKPAA